MGAIGPGGDPAVKTHPDFRRNERIVVKRPILVLSPGDRICGRIVQAGGAGRYQLRFGAGTLSAIIRFPVAVGDTISAVVSNVGPPLQLDAVGDRRKGADLHASTADGHRQRMADIFKQAIPAITCFLKTVDAGSNVGQSAEPIVLSLSRTLSSIQPLAIGPSADGFLGRLIELVSNSGHYFEKKLAARLGDPACDHTERADPRQSDFYFERSGPFRQDLKPHLLRLARHIAGMPLTPPIRWGEPPHEMLKTLVHLLLSDIGGQHRRLARQRRDSNAELCYQHLIFLNDHDQKATLRVFFSDKAPRRKRDRGHRVSLLLNLRHIGDLRVDLALHRDALQIHFFVGDDCLKQRFATHLDHLLTRLDGYFHLVNCQVSVSPSRIEDFHRVIIDRPTDGTLDVRV